MLALLLLTRWPHTQALAGLGLTEAQLAERTDSVCVVCLDARVADVLLVPCGKHRCSAQLSGAEWRNERACAGHARFCEACARAVRLRPCPLCRKPVADAIKMFR